MSASCRAGAGEVPAHDAPGLPELYRSYIQVDVAFVPVSRPDGEGYCGLGISNYAWRTIFENARTVIFEINEHLPRLQG